MNHHVDKNETRRRIHHMEQVIATRKSVLVHPDTPPGAAIIIRDLIREDEELLAFQRKLLDVNSPHGTT